MPLITRTSREQLLAFRLGSSHTLRETDEVIAQLQAQVRQHLFNEAQLREEIALLARELAEARWELAKRDSRDALANAISPSNARH